MSCLHEQYLCFPVSQIFQCRKKTMQFVVVAVVKEKEHEDRFEEVSVLEVIVNYALKLEGNWIDTNVEEQEEEASERASKLQFNDRQLLLC